jgi:hypothetical protein
MMDPYQVYLLDKNSYKAHGGGFEVGDYFRFESKINQNIYYGQINDGDKSFTCNAVVTDENNGVTRIVQRQNYTLLGFETATPGVLVRSRNILI